MTKTITCEECGEQWEHENCGGLWPRFCDDCGRARLLVAARKSTRKHFAANCERRRAYNRAYYASHRDELLFRQKASSVIARRAAGKLVVGDIVERECATEGCTGAADYMCRKGPTPVPWCKHCLAWRPPMAEEDFTDGRYYVVSRPGHPNASPAGMISAHRLVMSIELGRALDGGEVVHHKDGDRFNNDPDNLELCCRPGVPHPPGQRKDDLRDKITKMEAEIDVLRAVVASQGPSLQLTAKRRKATA